MRDPQAALAASMIASPYATKPMIAARTATERLRAEYTAAHSRLEAITPSASRESVAVRLFDAACDGEIPPGWAQELDKADADQRRARIEADVLRLAIDAAEQAEVSTAQAEAESVISKVLRRRLSKLLDTIASSRDVAHLGDEAALTLPDEQRARYVALKEAIAEYAALRGAQARCYALSGGQNNATDRFGEMRRLHEVWPTFAMGGNGVPRAPWDGMTAGQRLLWLIDHDAGLHMPTWAECVAMWREAVEAHAPKKPGSFVGTYAG